jgi:hypothetical protein
MHADADSSAAPGAARGLPSHQYVWFNFTALRQLSRSMCARGVCVWCLLVIFINF